MKLQLQTPRNELVENFSALRTRHDVANLLEIDESFLVKVLYGTKERGKYRTFQIQKKSKKLRQISAPPKNIAILQSKLNSILQLIYKPKYCVHGFAAKRSILSNAKRHYLKRHVVNIDLENFFPSVNIHRVIGALRSQPFSVGEDAATIIAQICCMDDGVLPQGSATSPIVSNIICRSLDNDLMAFAKRIKCQYTRYADDITLSTSAFHLPHQIGIVKDTNLILSNHLVSTIEKHDFRLNREKVRHSGRMSRQDVTGLTVNEFPNIRRSYIKSILGALYAWEKHGYDAANRRYLSRYQPRHHSGLKLNEVLKGRIAFVKMVLGKNSPLFRKLAKKYVRLSNHGFEIAQVAEISPYPLRGSQPKEGGWSNWFNKYREAVFFLETTNEKEDKAEATAFYIGNHFFATAGHNLKYRDLKLYFGGTAVSVDDHTTYDDTSIDIGFIRKVDDRNVGLPWIPTQLRLPEVGEEVAAIGFPRLPQRQSTRVMHIGIVEALPLTYNSKQRLIQVSFQSGGGLSGGCLLDRGGYAIGVMIENIFTVPERKVPLEAPKEEDIVARDGLLRGKESNIVYNRPENEIPIRPYGQAVPIEYLSDKLHEYNS